MVRPGISAACGELKTKYGKKTEGDGLKVVVAVERAFDWSQFDLHSEHYPAITGPLGGSLLNHGRRQTCQALRTGGSSGQKTMLQ